MAIFDFSASNAATSTQWNTFGYIGIIASPDSEFTGRTATGFTATWAGLTFKATGTNLKYDADHHPKSGTITSYEVVASGKTIIKLSGLSSSVTDIKTGYGSDFAAFHDFLEQLLSKSDTYKGSQANDYFEGFDGNDKIYGNKGDDHLVGGKGADTIDGGLGVDTLEGGSGADHFRFTNALGTTNKDYIINYLPVSDTIELSNAIFKGIGNDGTTLSASRFKALGAGDQIDSNDRIIYVKSSGDLYYDADGNGSQGAIKFAHLEDAPTITAADFLII